MLIPKLIKSLTNITIRLSSSSTNKMSLEAAKKVAAEQAVYENIANNMVIGIGSGSTIVYAVSKIAEMVASDDLDITCIPTSFQARQLIIDHGLKLGDLERNPEIDLTIDGADECDSQLNCIKGGGGCLLQEKVVAAFSKKLIIVADYTKKNDYLTFYYKKIPIEVSPMAYVPIKNRIESLFGGDLHLRMAVAKAGPVVTDNGNFLLDWFFDGSSTTDFEGINREIMMIPGVIDTGLFIGMASKAYFGMPDDTVLVKEV